MINYLTYKLIQTSILDKQQLEILKRQIIKFESFGLDFIKQYVEINSFITYDARENLYDLISYFRHDIKYSSYEEKVKMYELCNEIIGVLNTIELCSDSLFKDIESEKRYPENYNKIKNNSEIINDFIILNEFSNPIDSEIINKYVMNDQFLGSINAILIENPKIIYEEIFLNNLNAILDENIKRSKANKINKLDEYNSLYIELRTLNIKEKVIDIKFKDLKIDNKKAYVKN